MTYEQAIKTIKIAKAEVEWNYPMEYWEAFDIALDCINKRLPKKPIKVRCTNGRFSYLCPTCNIGLLSMCGCQYNGCGQAIDWSEVE